MAQNVSEVAEEGRTENVEKSEKRSNKRKNEELVKKKKDKKIKKDAATKEFSLLADKKVVDPALCSLFDTPAPVVPRVTATAPASKVVSQMAGIADKDEDEDAASLAAEVESVQEDGSIGGATERRRKRKRKDADGELEDLYMQRLAREEEKDAQQAAAERAAKRQKSDVGNGGDDIEQGNAQIGSDSEVEVGETRDDDGEDSDGAHTPPPKHETQEAADLELSKASRTVFLGNVSTSAISSKADRKTLTKHLSSFFDSLSAPSKDDGPHKLESIRFRSTPYATAIPKKAAYVRKELMDATAKSTNAYAVYSSPLLAREAAKRLNGTVILNRHLRVDEIAHPAKIDNRRCVFVGNLGFVDDESNIQDANEEDGREKRKRGKEPADIEEGLWRTFGKCGTVESVRVIRDSTTRVGKGIAYVQFEDGNAVEAALLYNEKKFPPMLPRKLRVSRAKAQKKNAKPGSNRPRMAKPSTSGYQRKIAPEEASKIGRAGKLFGRAAAAQLKQPDKRLGEGVRKPEDFVFEGYRSSSKGGKAGLKLGGKKKGKPGNRSAKRGAAYKAGQKKAK